MTRNAIQTPYRGHLFRSRLEARWAVFFDQAKIEWEYEIEGFTVGAYESRYYLPDFYLPKTKTWVEVKGSLDNIDWPLLADTVEYDKGLPGTYESDRTARGLLILGNIPGPRRDSYVPVHPILQHYKGGYVRGTVLIPGLGPAPSGDIGTPMGIEDFFEAHWPPHEDNPWVTLTKALLPGTYGVPSQGFDELPKHQVNPLRTAYLAAQSARFEHGESGGMLRCNECPRNAGR